MKILILIKRWPLGVGRYISGVVPELKFLGFDVKVISREEDLGIKSMLGSIFKLRKLVKKKDFDVLYTHDWSMAFPFLFPWKLFKKKHFCCFHGRSLSFFPRLIQSFVGMSLGRRLVVVGDGLKKIFPKAFLNFEAVNFETFRPLNKKRKYIGWLKRFWDQLTEEDIKSLSKQLGMPYFLAENIPADKMNEFYNKCEIFISLPPAYTGFNLCWLEAMAAGVPKVLGNESGIGCRMSFDKVNEHISVLESLKKLKAKDYRSWLINNNFTWKRHAQKLIKLFKNL